jgi:hypothetical protein
MFVLRTPARTAARTSENADRALLGTGSFHAGGARFCHAFRRLPCEPRAINAFRIAVLALAGLGFLGFGLWFLFDPIGPLAAIGIIAAGRLIGVAIDGVWVPFFTYALVWEVGFAVLAAAGLLAGKRPSR